MRAFLGNWSVVGGSILLAFFAFAVLGCYQEDAGVGRGGTGSFVSATPLNGSTGIAATEEIQLKVSGTIDQASLDQASATYEGGAGAVPGKMTYDSETGIIKVSPLRRLDNEESYRLTLSGLRDGEGNLLPPAVVLFTTNKNAVTKDVNYFSMNGHLIFVSTTSYDAKGRVLHFVQSISPGNDGIWSTSDDSYSYNVVYDYSPFGSEERRTAHTNPGPDGVWMTSDDVISSWQLCGFDEKGNLTRDLSYSEPGLDGVWFTADDRVFSAMTYSYDAKGNITRSVNLNGAGADGVWFTTDDLVFNHSDTEYAPDGSWMRSSEYAAAGEDGQWFTADDFNTGGAYTTYERDPLGNVIREVTELRSASGTTRRQSTTTYSYDAKGNPLRAITYDGAGPDEEWFTADDKVYSYTDTTYDANGNRTLSLSYYEPGPDGIFFTSDDFVLSRKEFDITQ